MSARAIPILLGLVMWGSAQTVLAQEPSDPMAAKLSAEKVSDVAAGSYSAADDINFTLTPYGDKYLLRFDGNPENFVLYGDRIALGGRELKYDTGAIALKISVWGGVTLYTQDMPGGLPATRTGDAAIPSKLAVPAANLTAALSDEENHLNYTQHLRLHFTADPSVIGGGDDARAYAFDTLVNSEMGIERIVGTPAGRAAFTHRFDTVRIVEGDKPTIAISGRTLLVSFVPSAGAAGRASSRAIAYALGKMLAVSEPA
ncbi:MAG TPA: DUF4908 domain-containing protein [Rhizomicrobium sp.]|nr:DUF4908 domain-containing protein [Rhizomicrobium sp.]